MKLICYGDSWTAGHGIEKNIEYKEDPNPPTFIKNLRNQNSWPRWLAEKIGVPYVNMGVCGYGNKYIYNEVIESIKNNYIENDDIVIIMFSYPFRYVKYDSETIIDIFYMLENLLKNHKHFYLNSFYPSFKNYDFDLNKLPNYFIEPYRSVSDILKEYEIKNNISVWEHESRLVWNDEKNFYEGDYHPNLLGYKIIGDYIYGQIKNKL